MKKNFFIKLIEKDEKMAMLKITLVLCLLIFLCISVEIILNLERSNNNSLYFLLYFLSLLNVFWLFLLENILVVIYLKFKINGEVNKFFKLNYVLLTLEILTMHLLYQEKSTFIILVIIALTTNIYKCFEYLRTFSKNKVHFWFALFGIFITLFSFPYFLYNYFFKILILLVGTSMIIGYQYIKKANNISNINYIFLFLLEIYLLITTSIDIIEFRLFIIVINITIITIIVNLRVIFPKIKLYTNFNKIQKIILIIGILFSFFTKVCIDYIDSINIKNISKQESDVNTSE